MKREAVSCFPILLLNFALGMLVEIVTVWNSHDGLSSPFRHCAVFFSRDANEPRWTFIIMFERVSRGYLEISCYIATDSDALKNSREESRKIGLRRLYPQNLCDKGLVRHIHAMLEVNDERLIPGLFYDAISGISKIERESPMALASNVCLETTSD